MEVNRTFEFWSIKRGNETGSFNDVCIKKVLTEAVQKLKKNIKSVKEIIRRNGQKSAWKMAQGLKIF